MDNAIDGLKIALNGEVDKIAEVKNDKANRVEVNPMVNQSHFGFNAHIIFLNYFLMKIFFQKLNI